ncbi:T-cell surface glycoprotein CD3 gamma chain-like [Seriola lalandi dorsalis]|uniref:T-cell surface glycoprotein CD3 gamma chain-like n=1 Tax=Seriola lalandi dorsalis TaxID=1841481 RepID=UPI000C6F8C4E|nr:T-cell surface glycoprotein CD3 gamma chain-like [Seriola lalandi dorsalis]XP_056229140.1 T-cell surface glycoprotein CD3 gamma chain-like [Seriola aureovittata]XP_056229141.1 T-cell surface glycoprotein CD3 gamma chain-like [Seriola aureovittata]
MKNHLVLPGCLLLLWTLTAFVSCADEAEKKEATVTVTTVSDGIKLSCGDNSVIINTETNENFTGHLLYSDDETGEYICSSAKTAGEELKIYVKFRTCDNCIELELASMMGIIIGDVVATIGIGVGIYLIAAHAQTGPVQSTSNKKSSDRQHLVPAEAGRSQNDHYQRLRHKGQKDTYDVIKNKKP